MTEANSTDLTAPGIVPPNQRGLPVVTRGTIDPSTVRRLSIPYTFRSLFTTDIGCGLSSRYMSDANRSKPHYLHIRWAVMVEGKEGLRQWEDAVHIFLSEDRAMAFQRALEVGHRAESSHEEGRRGVETTLAEIVSLEFLGADKTDFHIPLGSNRANEQLPFERVFYPEQNEPESVF